MVALEPAWIGVIGTGIGALANGIPALATAVVQGFSAKGQREHLHCGVIRVEPFGSERFAFVVVHAVLDAGRCCQVPWVAATHRR